MPSNAVIATSIFLLNLFATASALADNCSDVLSSAYDTNYSKGSSQSVKAAKSSICSRRSNSDSDNFSLGLNATGYGDLNIGRNTSAREMIAWCNNNESSSYLDDRFEFAIKTVHDSVVGAWQTCMAKDGATASLVYTDDPSKYFLIMKYRPIDAAASSTTDIDQILVDNLDCAGLTLNGGQIGSQKSFPCTRDPFRTTSVSINLKTVSSPSPLSLPASTRPTVPQHNVSGAYVLPDGNLNVLQADKRVEWAYENPLFTHSMTAYYFNGSQAIGKQYRVRKSDNCKVIMRITTTAYSSVKFCHEGTIDPGTPSLCDLSGNFYENVCHVR